MNERDTPFITNREVARILFQTAALLETMECNPFRVRAYRRAAIAVLLLPRQVADYASAEQAIPLSGVGERMQQHIVDLINHGRLDVHEALLEEVGEPLTSLLALEGVGPRTAIRLISELAVTSIADVAEAARTGRIQVLTGFGPKLEARLRATAERSLGVAA